MRSHGLLRSQQTDLAEVVATYWPETVGPLRKLLEETVEPVIAEIPTYCRPVSQVLEAERLEDQEFADAVGDDPQVWDTLVSLLSDSGEPGWVRTSRRDHPTGTSYCHLK